METIWKQLKCPPVDEQINKLWYIQTMVYYPVLKRNELSRHEKIWEKMHITKQKKPMFLSLHSERRLHSIGIQLNDILEKSKQWRL